MPDSAARGRNDTGVRDVEQREQPGALANQNITKAAPIDHEEEQATKRPEPGGMIDQNITQPAPVDQPEKQQTRRPGK